MNPSRPSERPIPVQDPRRNGDGPLRERALDVLGRLHGRVAVVGSLNADLTVETARLPRPGETVSGGPLSVLPGGKSANQAVASALLGVPTAIFGAVGRDAHGEMLIGSLENAGVSTGSVLRREIATGTALITVDGHGENTIVVSAGANGSLSGADVEAHASVVRDADVLGMCLEVGDEALLAAARTARAAGSTTVLNPSPLRELPAELVELTDVLVLNEHELAVLTGRGADAGEADAGGARTEGADEVGADDLAALARLGVGRAVVTLGARGCVVLDAGHLDAGRVHRVAAFPVRPVDTTGCGDAFTGAVLAALASRIPLVRGTELASAVAALAATRVGAQRSYAGADEVRDFLHGH